MPSVEMLASFAAPVCEVPTQLRTAGFVLQIENIRISLCDNPKVIALDRDGEGGEFSLCEFADMLRRFMSERL